MPDMLVMFGCVFAGIAVGELIGVGVTYWWFCHNEAIDEKKAQQQDEEVFKQEFYRH